MSLACETHISNHLEDILAFSGKSFGRIGNYNDCLTTTDLTYYLVGFLYQGNGIPPIGLCLPKECSADSVNTILTLLFKQAHLPLEVNYVAGDLDKFRISLYLEVLRHLNNLYNPGSHGSDKFYS